MPADTRATFEYVDNRDSCPHGIHVLGSCIRCAGDAAWAHGAATLDRIAAHENPAPAYSGPTGAALDRLQPGQFSCCKRCGSPVLDAEMVCPTCGWVNTAYVPPVLDWHAVIRDSLADCSVLLDRAEHDPASMHGVVARLLNAVTTLVDDNKALAEHVDRLTTRVDAQNRLVQQLASSAIAEDTQ